MGRLVYGAEGTHYVIDDTTLRHLRAAVIAKLRRQEPFALTLRGPGTNGAAETLWVQPAIALRFAFDLEDAGELDRERLEKLVMAANSAGGMQVDLAPAEPRLALAG